MERPAHEDELGASYKEMRVHERVAAGVGWIALAVAGAWGQDSRDLINTVLAHENDASAHRGRYMYLSEERSERTNGHLWTERIAETDWGKVRYLLFEDGRPLTGDRLVSERAKLAEEAAHPEAFKLREEAHGEDEQHARNMLRLLPRAFLFEPPKEEGDAMRINFRPNPDFSPGNLEERVLHSMVGSVLIDQKMLRTREIDGRIPQDISIGFGLLATIKAGSNFRTTRQHAEGVDWKTETVHTDFIGKALFLKTIARKEDAKHGEFKKIPDGMTVADAVKMVEQ